MSDDDLKRAIVKYDSSLRAAGFNKTQKEKIKDNTIQALKDVGIELFKFAVSGEIELTTVAINEIKQIIDRATAHNLATDEIEQAGITLSLAEARGKKAASDYANANLRFQKLKSAGCGRIQPSPSPTDAATSVNRSPTSVDLGVPDSNESSDNDNVPIQVGCQLLGTCK